MSDERSSPQTASKDAGPRTLGLVGLLIELLLPTALAAALLLVAASHLAFWDLRSSAGLVVFGVLLVAASLFASFRLDLFTLAGRRRRGKRQILNRAGAWPRLVKFVLGGVVIPLAALVAANRIELPDHRTPMTIALEGRLTAPALSGAERIGNAVVRAATSAARVEGVRALQAMDSGESLDQLSRILAADPAATRDGAEYAALVKALAAAGERARPRLLELLRSVPAGRRGAALAAPGTLFERHFSAALEAAKADVERRASDPAAGASAAARVRSAGDDLRRALDGVETELRPAGASGMPALAMDALLAMSAPADTETLAFARATAADASWSDAVRGKAMQLVAKLGGEGDLEALYAALDSPSPALRESALRAVADLQAKTATAQK